MNKSFKCRLYITQATFLYSCFNIKHFGGSVFLVKIENILIHLMIKHQSIPQSKISKKMIILALAEQAWQKCKTICTTLLYNHLKIRIVFSFPQIEPIICIQVEGPLPQSLPCCTAMFLQQPRMDKPNTGGREGPSCFLCLLWPLQVLHHTG